MKRDRSLNCLETSLNKHLQIQKDTLSSSADKDISIMRLQSDFKQAIDKLEELKREVSLCGALFLCTWSLKFIMFCIVAVIVVK